jgi:hypothetical protein
MKKQTAVEWFYWQIMYADVDVKVWKEIHDQALAMEKEQIIDAYLIESLDKRWFMEDKESINRAEQYYNETFTEQPKQ